MQPSEADAASTIDDWDLRVGEALRLSGRGRVEEREGGLEEALRLYERALSLLSGGPPTPLLSEVYRWMGTVRSEMGATDDARHLYTRALEVADEAGSMADRASALNCLAVIAQREGEMVEAESLYRQSARFAARAGEHRLAGMVEQNLGVLANIRGDLDGALVRYRASLREFKQARDEEGASWVLNNLGMLLTDLGEHARAESCLEEALQITLRRDDVNCEGLIQANRAEVFIALGRLRDAEAACRRGLEIAESRGEPLKRAEVLKFLSVVERSRGHLGREGGILDEADHLAESGKDLLLMAELLRERGALALERDEPEGARTAWLNALEIFNELNATLDAAGVEESLAALEGRAAAAEAAAEASSEVSADSDSPEDD